jgi:hypothetical protein
MPQKRKLQANQLTTKSRKINSASTPKITKVTCDSDTSCDDLALTSQSDSRRETLRRLSQLIEPDDDDDDYLEEDDQRSPAVKVSTKPSMYDDAISDILHRSSSNLSTRRPPPSKLLGTLP